MAGVPEVLQILINLKEADNPLRNQAENVLNDLRKN